MKYYTEVGNNFNRRSEILAIHDSIVWWRDMSLLGVGIPIAESCSEKVFFQRLHAAVGVEIADGWNYGVSRIFPRGLCNCFSGRLSVFRGLTNRIFPKMSYTGYKDYGGMASPD